MEHHVRRRRCEHGGKFGGADVGLIQRRPRTHPCGVSRRTVVDHRNAMPGVDKPADERRAG